MPRPYAKYDPETGTWNAPGAKPPVKTVALEVTMAHTISLDKIITQLKELQDELPVDSAAKAELTQARSQLLHALRTLEDEHYKLTM